MSEIIDDRTGAMLEAYIERFWGYGDWQAPIWFIGMEEGCAATRGMTPEERATRGDAAILIEAVARLRSWDQLGREALLDARQHIPDITRPHFVARPKLQRTWSGLIRIQLALEGRSTATESIRQFQRDEWARVGGTTCLVELFPLAAPDMDSWPYDAWSYRIPGLVSRSEYRAVLHAPRIRDLRELIQARAPRAVVCYGKTYRKYWRQLCSPAVLDDARSPGIATAVCERVAYAMILHPADRRFKPQYAESVATSLRQLIE